MNEVAESMELVDKNAERVETVGNNFRGNLTPANRQFFGCRGDVWLDNWLISRIQR